MLNGKQILIENTPGLGDLVMLTPTLRRLKELYPHCVLSVVSYVSNLPLVERLPYVDAVYAIERGKFLGRVYPALSFFHQDAVIFTAWQPQLALLAKLLRVSFRAGICREKYRQRNLFHHILPPDHFDAKDGEFKAAFLARQIFSALKIKAEIEEGCDISLPSNEECVRAKILLASKGFDPEQGYVVIAPFANTERSLPLRLVTEASQYIYERYGLSCVLVHGSKMQEIDESCKHLPQGILYNLAGETTLMEMAALLQGARMTLATDSGPMHMSCALGTETVAIFSSGNWRRYAPRCHCHLITLDMDCSPCSRESADDCKTHACMENITMDMIISSIKEILD